MTFCKTSRFSWKGVRDGVSFGKAVSPHVCNCTKKDVFTVAFLGIDYTHFLGSVHSDIRSDMFCKIGLFKNFGKLTRKRLCWSFFLIKLYTIKPATLLKRDFSSDVLLSILRNCFKHFFTELPR